MKITKLFFHNHIISITLDKHFVMRKKRGEENQRETNSKITGSRERKRERENRPRPSHKPSTSLKSI